MYPHFRALYGFASKLKAITTSSLVQVSKKHIHLSCRSVVEEQSKDTKGFIATYPIILEGLKTNSNEDVKYPEKRIVEFLDYTMANLPANYVIAFMDFYRGFSAVLPSEQDIRLAYIMTWCVEMHRTVTITMDDILDNKKTRRSLPCWYIVGENNAALAYNDSVMVLHYIYKLLDIHFREKFYYKEVFDAFHYATYATVIGQYLDFHISSSFRKTRNLDIFTWDSYHKLCTHKTYLSVWYETVWINMLMSGITKPELRRQVEETASQMSQFYQNLDDYLDCYTKSELGNDIENGSCTWLICTAVTVANPRQRSILQECYGIPEQDKIDAVLKVYGEIGMKNRFQQYYAEKKRDMKNIIGKLHKDLPKYVFLKMFDIHYDSQVLP